ncbi:hypothetical protein ACEE_06845 [Actinobacillus equuli subsp. equuli]|nr:hypothetical protein ACEE_06845 [Actinobacillus equuli subsp. equuli]
MKGMLFYFVVFYFIFSLLFFIIIATINSYFYFLMTGGICFFSIITEMELKMSFIPTIFVAMWMAVIFRKK